LQAWGLNNYWQVKILALGGNYVIYIHIFKVKTGFKIKFFIFAT